MSIADSRDEVRRKRAFEDFYNLPIKERSINKLYQIYVQRGQENPALAGEIPTRDRSVLYRWAKEDDWHQKALDRQDEEFERINEYIFSVQRRAYDGFAAIADDAVAVLYDKMRNSDNDKVAVDTAWKILETLGVRQLTSSNPIPSPKHDNEQTTEKNKHTEPTPLFVIKDDATDEDYLNILTEAVKNRV